MDELALTLYPTLEHDEIAVGPYVHEVASKEAAQLADGVGGLDVRWRMIGFRSEDDGTDDVWGKENALRVWRDGDAVRLDRLEITAVPLMGFRVRPELGEGFDWTIGSGRREVGWGFGNAAGTQWRVYSPIVLAPIGLSNTDQDDDKKLKYTISALGGLGGDVMGRLVGPVGAQLRVEGSARTARRFADDTPDNVRHEVQAVAEAGFTWLADRQAWTLGGWIEHLTQWNPRDGGPEGLDRQYVAGGVHLAARLYAEAEPDLAPADLETLFGAIDMALPIDRPQADPGDPLPIPEEVPVESAPVDEPAPTGPADAPPPAPSEPPPAPPSEPGRPPAGPTP